jgi:hypothetical protein
MAKHAAVPSPPDVADVNRERSAVARKADMI